MKFVIDGVESKVLTWVAVSELEEKNLNQNLVRKKYLKFGVI